MSIDLYLSRQIISDRQTLGLNLNFQRISSSSLFQAQYLNLELSCLTIQKQVQLLLSISFSLLSCTSFYSGLIQVAKLVWGQELAGYSSGRLFLPVVGAYFYLSWGRCWYVSSSEYSFYAFLEVAFFFISSCSLFISANFSLRTAICRIFSSLSSRLWTYIYIIAFFVYSLTFSMQLMYTSGSLDTWFYWKYPFIASMTYRETLIFPLLSSVGISIFCSPSPFAMFCSVRLCVRVSICDFLKGTKVFVAGLQKNLMFSEMELFPYLYKGLLNILFLLESSSAFLALLSMCDTICSAQTMIGFISDAIADLLVFLDSWQCGSSASESEALELGWEGLGLLFSCFLSLKEISIFCCMKYRISSTDKLASFFSTRSLMVTAFLFVISSSSLIIFSVAPFFLLRISSSLVLQPNKKRTSSYRQMLLEGFLSQSSLFCMRKSESSSLNSGSILERKVTILDSFLEAL